MFVDGVNSWVVREDLGTPQTLCLYVRDALRIDSGSDIPPLEPAVSPREEFMSPAVQLAGPWRSWFNAVADLTVPREEDPLPRYIEAAPEGDLRSLVVRMADDARAWIRARQREHMMDYQTFDRRQRMPVNHAVDIVERSRNRKVAPFSLQLTILPVRGYWSHRMRVDWLLVSRGIRRDPTKMAALLDPVVRELG